jgi:hypothetical protein
MTTTFAASCLTLSAGFEQGTQGVRAIGHPKCTLTRHNDVILVKPFEDSVKPVEALNSPAPASQP